MGLTRELNLKKKVVLDEIKQHSETDCFKSGYLKAVYVKSNDAWYFFIGKAVFTGETVDQDESLIYNDHAFVTKKIDKIGALEFINTIDSSGFLVDKKLPEIKSQENANWEREITPSHLTNSSYPEIIFKTTLNSNGYFIDGKLISFGMKFYPSASRHVRDYLGMSQFHGSSDARKGELSIIIKDTRGAIDIENNSIKIKGDLKNTLSIVGELDNSESICISEGRHHNVEIGGTSSIELWLVTPGSHIIDYYSSTEFDNSYLLEKSEDKSVNLYIDIIEKGECETVEFKKYISLVSNSEDSKSNELEKTICALSNRSGGYLFIGVTDDAEVVGFPKKIMSDYKNDILEECIDLYMKAIQRRLKEKLRDNQCFEIDVVSIVGHSVIVIRVDKSIDLNYVVLENNVYIRRGSSCMKMNPDEIRSYRNNKNTNTYSYPHPFQ